MKLHIIFEKTACIELQQAETGNAGSLAKLIAVGTAWALDQDLAAGLCLAAGVNRQADWPIAAIHALGDGIATLARAPDALDSVEALPSPYWLCADPVHLLLQRDYFTLADILPMSEQENLALLAALNQHFEGLGLSFLPSRDYRRWYLCLAEDPGISTTSPDLVIGMDTSAFMPQGPGAAKWNRVINEIQMLLFEHPLNQARELRGELAINSLWLSGGGSLPRRNPADAANLKLFGSNALIRGLQTYMQQALADVPPSAQDLLALGVQPEGADMEAKEVWLWMDAAYNAERLWFMPLWQALKKRKLQQLNLYFMQQGQTLCVQINALDSWKFWRKPKPLNAALSR